MRGLTVIRMVCSSPIQSHAHCRVLGSLLSAHLLIKDPEKPFGPIAPEEYSGELLELAHNLAARLLPAFENTSTGLPHPRVRRSEVHGTWTWQEMTCSSMCLF